MRFLYQDVIEDLIRSSLQLSRMSNKVMISFLKHKSVKFNHYVLYSLGIKENFPKFRILANNFRVELNKIRGKDLFEAICINNNLPLLIFICDFKWPGNEKLTLEYFRQINILNLASYHRNVDMVIYLIKFRCRGDGFSLNEIIHGGNFVYIIACSSPRLFNFLLSYEYPNGEKLTKKDIESRGIPTLRTLCEKKGILKVLLNFVCPKTGETFDKEKLIEYYNDYLRKVKSGYRCDDWV
jgi:hypothetical protein